MTSHCEVGHGGDVCIGLLWELHNHSPSFSPFSSSLSHPSRPGERMQGTRAREILSSHSIHASIQPSPTNRFNSHSMWSPPEHDVLLPANLTPSIVVPYGVFPGGGPCHRDSPPVATSTVAPESRGGWSFIGSSL